MLPAREGSLWIADLLGRTLTPAGIAGPRFTYVNNFPPTPFLQSEAEVRFSESPLWAAIWLTIRALS
jgi:hypothetical protein